MYFDWRLWDLTRGLRGRICWSVLMGLLALAAGIARFAFLGRFLAGVLTGRSVAATFWLLVGAAAAIILRASLDDARTMIAHRTAERMQTALRMRLFDKVVALGPAWFGAERTGGVMLSMVDGVEQLQTFFGQYLPQMAVAVCAPVAIFVFIAHWDVPVAAVMLAGALFTLILPAATHRRGAAAARTQQRALKSFGEEFLDAVQGLPTLKAFGQSGAFGAKLATKAKALANETFWVLSVNVATRGVTDLGAALGAAGALALGVWRVRHGAMSLEALLIVLMAGTEIFRPLRDLRAVLHQGMTGQSAATGINALLDAPETAPAAPASPVGPDRLAPGIIFEDVRFSYSAARRPAHRGIRFGIAPGERVGVVGPSGAGKSTIVRLLLRLHDPDEGVIRIGGCDLRSLDPAALRRLFAVVSQDTVLFHGTVAENLRLAKPDASEAELVEAAQAANAHTFIMALPDGYETVVGERGMRLSGGQRQRLAIARALLRDAPILILDEALSSVDAENEAVIQQALERLMRGRTTLILAHRLSSVINADRILVLEDGEVAEAGTHAELIARDGLYARLMRPQLAPGDEAGSELLPASIATEQPETVTQPATRALDEDAAAVGWLATLRTLLGLVWPWRGTLAVTVLCGVGRVISFIGVGVLGALAVAAVRAGANPGWLIGALLACAPLAGLLHWLESWIAHYMAYQLLAEMRIRLFATLDRLAPAYLLRCRSGDLVALATQDIETVEYFYAHTVAPAAVALMVPVAVLATLAISAWPLAAALLPFLFYAGASPLLGRSRVDALATEARDTLGSLSAYTTETIQGLAELIVFDATGVRRAGFAALAGRYQRMRLRLLRDLTGQATALEIATGLGGLVVAAMGAPLVHAGVLPASLLPLLILIAVAAFLPVSEIAQAGRQLADTIASTRRLHVVSAEPVTVTDGPREPVAPAGGSEVAFANVCFTYPERERPALRDVSFRVPSGATVALVGPSGAGKTTLATLLLRFWDPQRGAVRLDGVDLRELRLDGLRARTALVAQDTYLFNDTLEANVRLARPNSDAAAVARAIEQSALADVVAALPEGLATRVGERGVALSGGQRQRVAIARAFLKDAPVLVLDEATSHLDSLSEMEVRAALDTLMRARTTIVIAHRLSTVRKADLIVVLEEGCVVEAGTHAELLARRGVYARLLGRQMARVGA